MRYDHFQLMRGVACLMVLLNHVAGYLSSVLTINEFRWWVPLLVPTGFQWVWLFLVLSGFLLTKAFVTHRFALDRRGILAFYSNRAHRLLPMMWFAALLWIALYYSGIWSKVLPAVNWEQELMTAIPMPWLPYGSYYPISSANSPVWSAVIELHYCVVMPLFLLLIGTRVLIVFGALAIWGALLLIAAQHARYTGSPVFFPVIYGAHAYNAGFFLAGMALALWPGRAAVKIIPWAVVLPFAAAAMLAAQYISVLYGVERALAWAPFVVLPAAFLLVARADDNYIAKTPDTLAGLSGGLDPIRWIERFGIFSYSIYLLHKPIGYIVVDYLGLLTIVNSVPSYIGAAVIAAVPIIAFCAIAFVLVENRFRKARLIEVARGPAPQFR